MLSFFFKIADISICVFQITLLDTPTLSNRISWLFKTGRKAELPC